MTRSAPSTTAPGVRQLQTSSRAAVPEGLRWLESEVAEHRRVLVNEPFYDVVSRAKSVQEFTWARQLLHHSTEFPRVLAMRRDTNDVAEWAEFLAEHVEEEFGHCDMLTAWLHENHLVPPGETALAPTATNATVGCLSHGYRSVVAARPQDAIVSLNVAVEAASFDFFSIVSPILDDLGVGAEYWRLHMELDEFHSADGLALLTPVDPDSEDGRSLSQWAREAAAFWGAMLNSWVGYDRWPDLRAR